MFSLTDDDAWEVLKLNENYPMLCVLVEEKCEPSAIAKFRSTQRKHSINITHIQSTVEDEASTVVSFSTTTRHPKQQGLALLGVAALMKCSHWHPQISRILNAHIEAMNKRSGCPRERRELSVGARQSRSTLWELSVRTSHPAISDARGWCLASSTSAR